MLAKKPTLVLIDAHAIIHRAYHALPDLTTPSGEPAGALYGLAAMLVKLIKELKPDYIAAAYDLPGKTHRHEAYEEYKGTRAKTDDALVAQFDRSREIFKAFHVPMYDAPGFEADDIIGTLAEKLKKDFNIIIASGDMDTLQLVDGERVQVFTLKKGLNDTILYDEKAVEERYGFKPKLLTDYKGLRGDPSDNIIGVKGIGEKTATKIIDAYGTIENLYTALAKDREKVKEKAELTERLAAILEENQEEAEFSKVLATIRTDAPVAFDRDAAAWRDAYTADHALELFSELGFRSLMQRVKELNGEKAKGSAVGEEAPPEPRAAPAEEPADNEMFKEAAVMLFLIHSDITNPSLEDVLQNTKSKTIEEAHEKLAQDIEKTGLTWVWEHVEKPLIPVIARMNDTGVLIDAEYLKTLSKEYHKELDAIAKRIYRHAGEEFNINSPKQLGEILFEKLDIKAEGGRRKKTATGQISTKESELVKLVDEHPIIREILAYRGLAKLLGTYIDAIPPLLDTAGRLHTTFIQTGAATGRMASQNPGLQNIPVKTEQGRRIRHAFLASPGFVLAAFDYSQIELRIAAFLSEDPQLMDIFKRGEDVHRAVAAAVFRVSPEEVDYEMRRRAKVINFGILYGMGVNALKTNLEAGADATVPRAEAQEYLNEYFATFAGLAEYLTRVKADATRKGYTETLFGRRRYFPGLKSRLPYVRAEAERQAMNAPMQGTQADIIKLAMVEIDALIQKEYASDARMLLQVHDELIFEIKKEKVAELAPKILEKMQGVVPTEKTHGVPILSSSSVGPNWGELEAL